MLNKSVAHWQILSRLLLILTLFPSSWAHSQEAPRQEKSLWEQTRKTVLPFPTLLPVASIGTRKAKLLATVAPYKPDNGKRSGVAFVFGKFEFD